ncbi:polynucleotide adenylyltransferase [Thoreauomyces humboldtii]|nr:polynucleotide adenylyltransferase [Thoreauomyces humboldtii]
MASSQQQPQKAFGVTPPISMTEPTQKENDATDALVQTLKDLGLFESDEESRKRELVLGKLNEIFKEFVTRVGLRHGLPESMAEEGGGKIFTFGSYRLGVHGRGSDIDTLCVAPSYVKREDFFVDMYDLLKARAETTEITAVSDAYVPVINFEFSGIPIDLLFAGLDLTVIPDDLDLGDSNLLQKLDERCVRSLNGSRVTDEILRLVPDIDAFRIALRCIKLWAKRRAIYSNVMGFFGGVAWAILVARVCQLYPNAAAGAIVSKFFRIMHKWAWPQPVLLKHIEDGPLSVRVWNPKIYPQDKAHRMPIITPAYPSMCATHNVTESTRQVTTQEFERAADIADRIMVGSGSWIELFTKSDFFTRYKYYLQVIASSDQAESQLRWSGMVESRLRHLVKQLELVDHLDLAHPYIKGFNKVCKCVTEEERGRAAHGIFPAARPDPDADTPGLSSLYTSTFYIGLSIKAKDPSSNTPRKLDISWPTRDFVSMVKAWDKFDCSTMGIVVQYMKSVALPAEVFEEGEQPKPLKNKRPKSRNRSNAAPEENPTKKRRASITEAIPTQYSKEAAEVVKIREQLKEDGPLSPFMRTETLTTGSGFMPGTPLPDAVEDFVPTDGKAQTPGSENGSAPAASTPRSAAMQYSAAAQRNIAGPHSRAGSPANGAPTGTPGHAYGGMSGVNVASPRADIKLRMAGQHSANGHGRPSDGSPGASP